MHGVRGRLRRRVVRNLRGGNLLDGRIAHGVWGLRQQLFHVQRDQRGVHRLQPGLRRVNVHRVHRGNIFSPRQSRRLHLVHCWMQRIARHMQSIYGHVRCVRGGIRRRRVQCMRQRNLFDGQQPCGVLWVPCRVQCVAEHMQRDDWSMCSMRSGIWRHCLRRMCDRDLFHGRQSCGVFGLSSCV